MRLEESFGAFPETPLAKLDGSGSALPPGADWAAGARMIHDRNTGLFWELKSPEAGSVNDCGARYTFAECGAYLSRLNAARFGGFDDWRLPNRDELRSLIGYVPQKNVLFSGDIASNLNFGRESGTEEDWREAAQIACAEEFILKKQHGYHDTIAQGGTNLSGGQRQRMAIARAVMKKPEIYLFDDSFSALDMKTDQTLRRNLKAAVGDAAVIMVAQRISTILDADRILVVDDGMIVGQGTHRELLDTCPLYREIAEIQLGKEAV